MQCSLFTSLRFIILSTLRRLLRVSILFFPNNQIDKSCSVNGDRVGFDTNIIHRSFTLTKNYFSDLIPPRSTVVVFSLNYLPNIIGSFLRREVYQPKSTLVFLAFTQHSTDQRFTPDSCFLVVTYALSLLMAHYPENKPFFKIR